MPAIWIWSSSLTGGSKKVTAGPLGHLGGHRVKSNQYKLPKTLAAGQRLTRWGDSRTTARLGPGWAAGWSVGL